MNPASLAVRNPQFTVVVFIMVALLGVASLFSIPKSEDPTPSFPFFVVIAALPGATAGDVEQLVVKPLEEGFGELDDVKRTEARIEDGVAVVGVEFDYGVDVKAKYGDLVREVGRIRAERMPAEVRSVEVQRTDPDRTNIVQLALVSTTASDRTMDELADRLETRLEAVPGVRSAERWASPVREVTVELDLPRLATRRLSVGQVLGALGGGNVLIPGGAVAAGPRRFTVRTTGSFTSLDEVRRTPLGGATDGAVVRLEDVARVSWGSAEPTHLGRFDGKRAVFLTANGKAGVTIFTVRDGIRAALDGFERTLPAEVRLERGFDQSVNVGHRLRGLAVDFAIALGLVVLTLLPLGPRAAGVVMISIPLSLAVGIALLDATGFSLNQLSIAGLVIALGLLVDDSIVVVENITRFLRQGYSRTEAAIKATGQIAVAVVGATATLVFAFLPLLKLPGGPGDFIRSLPAAVVYTVVASLVVSLTIIPFLASRLLSKHEDPEGNRAMRWLHRGIEASYRPVLHRSLAHPWRTLALSATLLVGALALVPAIGFSLFPKADTPQVMVTVETPVGSTLAETDRATRFAERVLLARPEVAHVFANVGRANPRIFYNQKAGGEQTNIGGLFVLLKGYDPDTTPAFFGWLRDTLATERSAKLEVKPFENGPPLDAPIALRLVGPDLDTLRALAGRLETIFRSTAGTIYVTNPIRRDRTDLRVEVDRDRAGLYGVPVAEVARTIRLATVGLPGGVYREADGEERPITVRLPGVGLRDPSFIDDVFVGSPQTGAQVPLGQLATVALERSTPLMRRYNGERTALVTADVAAGANTQAVTAEILRRAAAELHLPTGYRIVPAGELESSQNSFGGLGSAIIVAIFMVIAVLVLEFRTFRSMLIVVSVIPLGVIGGLAALWLTGNTLSFTAAIGFVALVGIEIKTSILLVDFTHQLRAEGMAIGEAVEQAGAVRFVPVVLTSATAIGGLLPLATSGSDLYAPLAWVIIGGLVSSTVLARLVTPVLYRMLAPAIHDVTESRLEPAVAA